MSLGSLAGELAADKARLTALRGKLKRLTPDAALFNVAVYTRHLEALFTEMWQRHVAGLPPQTIGAV